MNVRPVSGKVPDKLNVGNVGGSETWFRSAQVIFRRDRNHILQASRPISIIGEVPWDTQTLILPFINGGPGTLA
jgi:hypothetical protein